MRILIAAVVLALSSLAASPFQGVPGQNPSAAGTASIAGTLVTDEASPVPVRRARVTATIVSAFAGRTTITDDAGRFQIQPLPAGSYVLSASRTGYVPARLGATRPGRAGTPIALADGQRVTNIVMRIMRGAAIDGVVHDQTGAVAADATVKLREYRVANGERSLAVVAALGDGRTDDRGHYRFFGLPPGEYFVSVDLPSIGPQSRTLREVTSADIARASGRAGPPAGTPAGPTAPVARSIGLAPVYYPGTPLVSAATPVRVGAGEERTGIDFALQLVPTATVEGVVSWASADAGAGAGATLSLTALDAASSGRYSSAAGASGAFRITGVPPGRYQLIAESRPGSGRAGTQPATAAPAMPPPVPTRKAWWASTEVVVDGRDVGGVSLTLDFAPTVSGRVAFRGASPAPADLTTAFVDFTDVRTGGLWTRAKVGADGAFTAEAVRPGIYRLSAGVATGGPASIWSVESLAREGQDITDVPFDAQPGRDVVGVVVTFTDRVTELSGTLKDAGGRAATAYFIVVFAANRGVWAPQSRWIAQTRPANDGRFAVKGLPPGDYYVAALTDVEPGEWYDANFLQSLVPAAARVKLAAGQKTVQDLAIR